MATQTKDQESLANQFKAGVEKAKRFFTESDDIVSVIKEDHKPLKDLIKIMKDGDRAKEERLDAFTQFAPLLVTHARAEEESLYEFMKSKAKLRTESFEGVTEHELADQMVESIKRATDNDVIMAQIKVLAEMVEHHIDEEESEMLPQVKDELSEKERKLLVQKYSDFQAELIADGQDDAPPEKELEKAAH